MLRMVQRPPGSLLRMAPTGSKRNRSNCSPSSLTESSRIGTETVFVVSPGLES